MNEGSVHGLFLQMPKWRGHWEIGGPTGLRVMATTKPPWLHRYMAKILLGWKWRDAT